MPVPMAVAPRLIAQQIECFAQTLLVFAQHDGVGAELLPERHWHRVCDLYAPDLEQAPELGG